MDKRIRFFKALKREDVDRVPVFPLLMFFSASRNGLSYKEFATNGLLLAEAQIITGRKFGLDAITACSDAFRLSQALGGEMVYPENKPPFLAKTLVENRSDLRKLGMPDPSDRKNRMGDRVLAVSEMSRAVSSEMVVLGWVDMPFAEACSICGVSNFMLMLMDEPELAREVLEFLTGAVKVFASAQIDAGADMIGAGDAAASLLSKEMYADFVLPYEKEIIDDIHARGKPAKLHICGNTEHIIEEMAESGADLYNVDSAVDFSRAKAIYSGRGKCFKGNLDPVGEIMQKSAAECEKLAHNCIASSGGAGYMLSAGCEIPAETPDEVFGAFCGAARTFNGIRPGG